MTAERSPRRPDGLLLGITETAALLGLTRKAAEQLIARSLLPHRRLGGRVYVLRHELEGYLARLPGVTADEALAAVAARRESR